VSDASREAATGFANSATCCHLAKVSNGGNLGPAIISLHVVPEEDVPSEVAIRKIKLQRAVGQVPLRVRSSATASRGLNGASICFRMAISCSLGSLTPGSSSKVILKPPFTLSEG
jgi:hypothetical protein